MNEDEKRRLQWLLSESEKVEGIVCVGHEWPADLFSNADVVWLEDEIEDIMEMGWKSYRHSRALKGED